MCGLYEVGSYNSNPRQPCRHQPSSTGFSRLPLVPRQCAITLLLQASFYFQRSHATKTTRPARKSGIMDGFYLSLWSLPEHLGKLCLTSRTFLPV